MRESEREKKSKSESERKKVSGNERGRSDGGRVEDGECRGLVALWWEEEKEGWLVGGEEGKEG